MIKTIRAIILAILLTLGVTVASNVTPAHAVLSSCAFSPVKYVTPTWFQWHVDGWCNVQSGSPLQLQRTWASCRSPQGAYVTKYGSWVVEGQDSTATCTVNYTLSSYGRQTQNI